MGGMGDCRLSDGSFCQTKGARQHAIVLVCCSLVRYPALCELTFRSVWVDTTVEQVEALLRLRRDMDAIAGSTGAGQGVVRDRSVPQSFTLRIDEAAGRTPPPVRPGSGAWFFGGFS